MELESIVLMQGAAIGCVGGLIIGIAADREFNPEIELAKLVQENGGRNESLEQQASSNRLQKRIVEGIVALGIGITSAYYIGISNGGIDTAAYLLGVGAGEFIGRIRRYGKKLSVLEMEAIMQHSYALDNVVASGNKEAISKMLERMKNYVKSLFYKKKNIYIFSDPFMAKFDEKIKAARYKIGEIESPTTTLNTPS